MLNGNTANEAVFFTFSLNITYISLKFLTLNFILVPSSAEVVVTSEPYQCNRTQIWLRLLDQTSFFSLWKGENGLTLHPLTSWSNFIKTQVCLNLNSFYCNALFIHVLVTNSIPVYYHLTDWRALFKMLLYSWGWQIYLPATSPELQFLSFLFYLFLFLTFLFLEFAVITFYIRCTSKF